MSLTTPAARRDLSFHLHPATNLRSVQSEGPLVIARGDGVYVYDDEGNLYLEGMAGLWCASLGFSERRLAEAAYKQRCELPFYHSFAGKVPAISTELAERLIGRLPRAWPRCCSRNSGSEANDTAIKLAWYVNNALGLPHRRRSSRGSAPTTVSPSPAEASPGSAFAQTDFDLRARAPAHRLPALLPWPRSRARARRHSPRGSPRISSSLSCAKPRYTVAAVFRRAGDGRRRRDRPPATYFDRVQPI